MTSAAARKIALEELLRQHRLRPEGPPLRGERRRGPLSTGHAEQDARLFGGLPRGELSEAVGPASSGRTGLGLATAARVTGTGGLVAWVDPMDRLDPQSAAAAGLQLERLLWLRGGAGVPRSLPDAVRAVVARGAPYLKRAQVAGPGGAPVLDSIRTNDAMAFAVVETDVVIQSIDSLVARVLDSPAENGEPFALLRYRPGQAYAPHCDWIDPRTPGKDQEVATSGQRVATLLVYLNDDFRGGETHFVRLNWSFKGKRGDALLWRNVTEDGSIDPMTVHAGLSPTTGEKWLLSKWMRNRPQSPRVS